MTIFLVILAAFAAVVIAMFVWSVWIEEPKDIERLRRAKREIIRG